MKMVTMEVWPWDGTGKPVAVSFFPQEGRACAVGRIELAPVVGREGWWRFRQDAVFWDGERLDVVPRGFVFDGTSRPWLVKWYVGRDEHLAAAGFHDWCYRFHRVCAVTPEGRPAAWFKCSKGYADRVFRQLVSGVYAERGTKSAAMWLAVCAGGWPSWLVGTCDWRCGLGPGRCRQEELGCPVRRLRFEPPQLLGTVR
jgi:hypothetical protein